MKRISTLFMLFALLVLSANAFATQVSMPTNITANAGATVDIPVNIDTAAGVAAYQIIVTYNASVLNCTTVEKGSLISTGWDAMTVNAQTGQIFGSTNSSDLSELGGVSGNLALIRCTAVGSPGANTSLHFSPSPATALVNGLGNPIISTLVDGTFTISGGQCVPSTEVCDGIDNDCDGQVDEGLTRSTTCGIGACAATGTETCTAGAWGGNTCTPGAPQTEGPAGNATCSDQSDNDCDGTTDAADSSCQGTQSGMDQWVGTWFSVKVTLKGSTFSTPDSRFLADKDGGNGYMNIWSWDPDTKELHYDYYEYIRNEGKWESYTDKFHFFAGTDLKFLFSYNNTAENFVSAFTGVIEGKVQKGILKSATIKSLGGYYTEVYNDNTLYSTGLQTLTGKMINESKVPVPAEVRIQH